MLDLDLKNWGLSLKNMTLTELSKYRDFAAKRRDEKSTKGVALVFKDRLFVFLPFSWWKRSYFELLIKFKKNGHTICDPIRFFKKYLAASWCKTVLKESWSLNTNATLKRVKADTFAQLENLNICIFPVIIFRH